MAAPRKHRRQTSASQYNFNGCEQRWLGKEYEGSTELLVGDSSLPHSWQAGDKLPDSWHEKGREGNNMKKVQPSGGQLDTGAEGRGCEAGMTGGRQAMHAAHQRARAQRGEGHAQAGRREDGLSQAGRQWWPLLAGSAAASGAAVDMRKRPTAHRGAGASRGPALQRQLRGRLLLPPFLPLASEPLRAVHLNGEHWRPACSTREVEQKQQQRQQQQR